MNLYIEILQDLHLPLAEMLTKEWMVGFCVLIIGLVFLYSLVFDVWWRIRCVNHSLKQAIKQLSNLGKDKQQEIFFNNFEDISASLSNIPAIKHTWKEYVESMFFGDANSGDKRVYISHRPSQYFSRDSVLGSRLNLSQFFAFPNYLIGLGLTFTFIGLAAALDVAQAGLANGQGQQALKQLLAVASIKFISSIAGIVSSIALSVFQKRRIKTFHKNLGRFCNLLEECTEYKSTEKLLYETYKEQQKQTLALNDMATNISEGIGNVLSNQLPASVATALEPLAQEIRLLAQKFSSSNENALESVLNEFILQLRKSSEDDMHGLIESVKTLKGSLDILVINMQKMGENFGSETKDSTARLASMLENFVTSFAPVQQGIGQFGQALVSLEHIASKIENAGGSISGAADVSNKSMSQLAGTVNDMSSNLAPMKDLILALTQALAKVDSTSEQLKAAGGTIAYAADGFKDSATSIGLAEDRFSQKVQTFERIADGISGTVVSLERASGQMANATQPFGELSGGLVQAIRVMQETEERMQRNQQEMHTMLAGLQRFANTIPDLWEQYEDRFNKVDGDLAKAFQELSKGSIEFNEGVKDFVEQLDQHFSTAIKGLSGAVKELAEERENSNYPQKAFAG